MVERILEHKLVKNQVFRFVLSAGMGFLVDISAFYLFYHNLLVQHTYQIFSYTVRNSTLSLAISFFIFIPVYFFTGIRIPERRMSTIVISILMVAIVGIQFSLTALYTPVSSRPATSLQPLPIPAKAPSAAPGAVKIISINYR